jgi:hypothetical protein
MKLRHEISVEIRGGKLSAPGDAREALLEALEDWPDCEATLIIERKTRRQSSDAARGYYFGVLVKRGAAALHCNEDAFHEMAKAMCLERSPAIRGHNGWLLRGEHVVGGSLSRLGPGELADYITRVRDWMAGALGCETPDADPNYKQREE